ncbi:MAG: phosphate ABC transporter permease subunit PstC [Fimbriimonadales bacterium]
MRSKHQIVNALMSRVIQLSVGLVAIVAIGILGYLIWESKDAFKREYGYGYRFALQPEVLRPDPYTGEVITDISQDPNAAVLCANKEGSDGIDEKDELLPLQSIDQLSGVTSLVVAAKHGDTEADIFRDNFSGTVKAGNRKSMKFIGFATPEFTEKKMVLAWQPDAGFTPNSVPFKLTLNILRTPDGVTLNQRSIDLGTQPTGKLKLPAYIAKSDADRLSGYEFELLAEPTMNQTLAVISSLATTRWEPTGLYESFGVIALLLTTLLLTIVAVLIAAPLGIGAALFLSEIASPKVREWVKPAVELLASVPTVVLGFIGLMFVAPNLLKYASGAFHLSSGRCFLTAAIMLAVLLLPMVATLAEDAYTSVPNSLHDAAEAMGLNRFERMRFVVSRAARPGVITAILLTTARGIGETMIIWILSGGSVTPPSGNPLQTASSSVRGIPDTIAIEMGNVEFGGVHYGHLFIVGLLLFAVTFSLNIFAHRLQRKAMALL